MNTCSATTKLNKRCSRKPSQNGLCTIHGTGFASNFKRTINAIKQGPAEKPSSKLQSFMDNNNNRIVQLRVGRKPINTAVCKLLDKISFGRFSKKAREMDYGDVFHNYILVTLDDGRTIKLEKNEIVQESDSSVDDLKNELFNVPLGDRSLSVKQLIDNAANGGEKEFYRYRAGSDNCQKFTQDIVVRNGLIGPNLTQDAGPLIDQLPLRSTIPNLITDAAAVAHRVISGDGIIRRQIITQKQKIKCPL